MVPPFQLPFTRTSSRSLPPRALQRALLVLLIAVTPGCSKDDAECPDEARPREKFTFRLLNRSATPRELILGCGANPPIELDTPRGTLRIGPESADVCGNTCDLVLLGVKPSPCTDCGGYRTITLPPGLSTPIEWDRRVWVPATIPPSCSHLAAEAECALGVAVDVRMVTGRLLLCGDELPCPESRKHTFTADLSLDGVDIAFP